jgi:hypothetical protein
MLLPRGVKGLLKALLLDRERRAGGLRVGAGGGGGGVGL